MENKAPDVIGITLRDYFAARAMQSFLECYARNLPDDAELTAQRAYEVADAMLAERGDA